MPLWRHVRNKKNIHLLQRRKAWISLNVLRYDKMTQMKTLINKAQNYCIQNNLRLTEPRLHVLKIFAETTKPMGAYDVLEKLGTYINHPKPPTAYRAIDFWREHGFIHRIESLNAYVTCCQNHEHHNVHFLVCDDCHSVEELHKHPIQPSSELNGFKVKKTFSETHGTCTECSSSK